MTCRQLPPQLPALKLSSLYRNRCPVCPESPSSLDWNGCPVSPGFSSYWRNLLLHDTHSILLSGVLGIHAAAAGCQAGCVLSGLYTGNLDEMRRVRRTAQTFFFGVGRHVSPSFPFSFRSVPMRTRRVREIVVDQSSPLYGAIATVTFRGAAFCGSAQRYSRSGSEKTHEPGSNVYLQRRRGL